MNDREEEQRGGDRGAEGSKGEWDLSDEATESNCEYIIRVLKRDYVACGT